MRVEDHRRDLTRDSRPGLIHSSVPEEKWTVGVGSGGSGHLCTWLEVKSVTGWTTGIGHRISRGGGLRSIGRRGVLPLTPVKVAGCSTVINHST
ncbi:uncharacterized protein LOC117602322 isoform X2 [Osmia lignaria lignaria]|uniref:uncharacterized protein LOC117602322 isoform X2 n=1 Tax=Osmia lignaria lignaria TaxID=1437193 RepID=UPI0014788B71|nr:uncharacterized protein LOC117602322 isoform X2 [Osmia lignaria]